MKINGRLYYPAPASAKTAALIDSMDARELIPALCPLGIPHGEGSFAGLSVSFSPDDCLLLFRDSSPSRLVASLPDENANPFAPLGICLPIFFLSGGVEDRFSSRLSSLRELLSRATFGRPGSVVLFVDATGWSVLCSREGKPALVPVDFSGTVPVCLRLIDEGKLEEASAIRNALLGFLSFDKFVKWPAAWGLLLGAAASAVGEIDALFSL
jgi:hypothetical protein